MACRPINNAGLRAVLDFGILLLVLTQLTADAQNEFTWKDASQNTHNLSDLEEILQKHRQWIESLKKSGTQADLSKTSLFKANLSNANLSDANLSNANLVDANPSNAKLTGADLSYAILFGTNLNGAAVDLAKSDGVVFEPSSLPELRGMSRVENLELLTYIDNPVALVQLRKQFEDGGLRDQERKITYALKRREAELSWATCSTSRELPGDKGTRAIIWSSDSILANFASFILNKVFFDWTCQYGMSPGRPLILGVVILFLCSLIYLACIHSSGEAGLYRVHSQSIQDDPSTQRRVTRISAPRIAHRRGLLWLLQLFRREFLLWRTSMFFSLMSAFNIGFRDINFGRWLRSEEHT